MFYDQMILLRVPTYMCARNLVQMVKQGEIVLLYQKFNQANWYLVFFLIIKHEQVKKL